MQWTFSWRLSVDTFTVCVLLRRLSGRFSLPLSKWTVFRAGRLLKTPLANVSWALFFRFLQNRPNTMLTWYLQRLSQLGKLPHWFACSFPNLFRPLSVYAKNSVYNRAETKWNIFIRGINSPQSLGKGHCCEVPFIVLSWPIRDRRGAVIHMVNKTKAT